MRFTFVRMIVAVCSLSVAMAAWDRDFRFAYVADSNSNSVAVIDRVTNSVLATVGVGSSPGGVAVKPDGKQVWVATSDSATLAIYEIDTSTNSVASVISTPCPGGCLTSAPGSIAFAPDGKRAYWVNNVALPLGGTLSVIDIATNKIVDTIQVGHVPEGVAVTPDGKRAYVTNSEDFSVSVIDTKTDTVMDTIGSLGNSPWGVAVTPDGKYAYVPTCAGPAGVSVIDTKTNAIVTTVLTPGCPLEIAISPNGRVAYVTDDSSNEVLVIDIATNTLTGNIPLGSSCGSSSAGATGVAFGPFGRRAYVTNQDNNCAYVVDTVSKSVVDTIPGLSAPIGVAVSPLP